jgi:hypothetical protein
MKRITVVVFALLIVIAVVGIGSGCATDKASVAQLSTALKRCYALEHLPSNIGAFDHFTVKDLEVLSKTNEQWGTTWSVRAKLYDPNDQYVEDIAGKLHRISLGSWVCQ